MFIYNYIPIGASSVPLEAEATSPVQVVEALQKLGPHELSCADETWSNIVPVRTGAKLKSYLSKEMYKLFMWEKCSDPELPPHDGSSRTGITWDIRFGFDNGGESNKVKNIRISPTKYQGSDKAIIKLLFDPTNYDLKNITTTYTLIREDGHWKIDDIAPKGDKPNLYGDTALEHSNSIKTDMQKNYDAAMKRYQQEQTKQNATP